MGSIFLISPFGLPTAIKPKPRLKNLDDLFLLNQESNPTENEISVDSLAASDKHFQAVVELDLLSPFANHPFHLYQGERLDDMVYSIKTNGVLVPVIARENANKLEILAGHNRVNASRIAGLTSIPAIVLKNVSDEEAWIYVVETNLMQRSFADMSHSEKAAVISVQHSKLFSQGKRNDILAELNAIENPHESGEDGTFAQVAQKSHSDRKIAEMYSLSKDTVARYLRIYKLTVELKSMLDAGIFAFIPAVTISFLKEPEQKKLAQCIELNSFSVDMKKADVLRQYSESGKLDDESIYLILNGEIGQKPKPNRTPVVKVRKDIYAKYFQPSQSDEEVQSIVEKALELYFEKQ